MPTPGDPQSAPEGFPTGGKMRILVADVFTLRAKPGIKAVSSQGAGWSVKPSQQPYVTRELSTPHVRSLRLDCVDRRGVAFDLATKPLPLPVHALTPFSPRPSPAFSTSFAGLEPRVRSRRSQQL